MNSGLLDATRYNETIISSLGTIKVCSSVCSRTQSLVTASPSCA